MHEFAARNKEVTALLYLPRTLQCLVGIGYLHDRDDKRRKKDKSEHDKSDRTAVVRWPDPSASGDYEVLEQDNHHMGVGSIAYFETIVSKTM